MWSWVLHTLRHPGESNGTDSCLLHARVSQVAPFSPDRGEFPWLDRRLVGWLVGWLERLVQASGSRLTTAPIGLVQVLRRWGLFQCCHVIFCEVACIYVVVAGVFLPCFSSVVVSVGLNWVCILLCGSQIFSHQGPPKLLLYVLVWQPPSENILCQGVRTPIQDLCHKPSHYLQK